MQHPPLLLVLVLVLVLVLLLLLLLLLLLALLFKTPREFGLFLLESSAGL
jgi:hypothetical protein